MNVSKEINEIKCTKEDKNENINEVEENESEINDTYMNKNIVVKYTPFNFNFQKNLKQKKNNITKKFFAFTYCLKEEENSNINNNTEQNNILDYNIIENNKISENIISENNIFIKDEIKNNKISENKKIEEESVPPPEIKNGISEKGFMKNLEDIVKEEEENEYSDSENNVENVPSHSYSDNEFGINNDFIIRPDSCFKILVVDIVNTLKKINPKYDFQINKQEKITTILTVPSEPVGNNGKDNIEYNLIVCSGEEIKSVKNSYIIIDLLGSGISGIVYKVLCQSDNKYYALKIIKNRKAYYAQSLIESKFIKYLNDQEKNGQSHFTKIFDVFNYFNHLCMLFELLDQDLNQMLKMNNRQGISLSSIRFISKQLFEGVELIHKCKIVHADLKPENILLTVRKEENLENINQNNNNNISSNSAVEKNNTNNTNKTSKNKVSVKIGDFGNSSYKSNNYYAYVQSTYYRAPEVILGIKYDEKIDIWSVACILAELYLGNPILPGVCSYDQLLKITECIGEIPQYLIENCGNKNKYFIKENNISDGYYYRIKNLEEYYNEFPNKEKPKYSIQYDLTSLDDLINVKRETIKMNNSLHNSMHSNLHSSTLSLNSSNSSEDLVAFIHLLKGMFQIDPKKRWNAKQCLRHPFLTKEKLDKFISFEPNEVSQFIYFSNNNSNNEYHNNNKNCYSMMMEDSFNKYQMGRFGPQMNFFNNVNKNNNVQQNLNNSFGNYNQNYFNNYYNMQMNNIQNNNIGINNNQFMQNNNINNISGENNQRGHNGSFTFNNNNVFQVNLDLMKMEWLKKFPYAMVDKVYSLAPNNIIPGNNQNFFNNNPHFFPNKNQNNFNKQFYKLNNTFMGNSFEKLNTSYNSNKIKHCPTQNSNKNSQQGRNIKPSSRKNSSIITTKEESKFNFKNKEDVKENNNNIVDKNQNDTGQKK